MTRFTDKTRSLSSALPHFNRNITIIIDIPISHFNSRNSIEAPGGVKASQCKSTIPSDSFLSHKLMIWRPLYALHTELSLVTAFENSLRKRYTKRPRVVIICDWMFDHVGFRMDTTTFSLLAIFPAHQGSHFRWTIWYLFSLDRGSYNRAGKTLSLRP
jgi:hypothetical protein